MKFLAGLITTALTATLLTLGLGAATVPAQANHCGYNADIRTFADAWSRNNPSKKKRRVPFAVRVRSEFGSPNARLIVIIKRRGNGKTVYRGDRWYNGGRKIYRTPPMPRGKFKVRVRAKVRNHCYKNSNALFGQRVTR